MPTIIVGLVIALALAATIGIYLNRRHSDGAARESSLGLPDTPDYHSLSVAPNNERVVLLGTHQGLYRSSDGGRTWRFAAIGGHDAMNLARARDATLWTAGHNVLARSGDGGRSWVDVRPNGLPSLDLHGFTTDPLHSKTLFAAVAGEGLYRSTDDGHSFRRVSDVGGAVMALAMTPRGELFAGDMQRGLLASSDGARTWHEALNAQVAGLAVNPSDPRRILASGPGILLSADGGRSWRRQLEVSEGVGPVAWSPSNPRVAYAVGFDRVLYRSGDGGKTWSAVG